jgi:ketosteroid isomerase-like protein
MNTTKATAEAESRAQVDSWLHAVLTMDLEGIVAHYAPGLVWDSSPTFLVMEKSSCNRV